MKHKALSRRRRSKELKAHVLEQCQEPGASIAAVALAHGLNANLVHKWRRQAARLATKEKTPVVRGFIALPMASAAASSAVAPDKYDRAGKKSTCLCLRFFRIGLKTGIDIGTMHLGEVDSRFNAAEANVDFITGCGSN